MARRAVFLSEHVPGMRGLAALTEPDDGDRVAAIVDVAVIGARGDGKTQFIVHAIRTLRAYGPALLGPEREHHRDIMRVVLDARAPRPDATAPGVVPHYVFRIRPAALMAGLGLAARLRLLALGGWFAGAGALGAGVGGAMAALGGRADLAAVVGLAVAGAGATFAARAATARFARGAEIEVVFWDVAGEHVYSPGAADYHAFLDTLVRERRRRAGDRRYAFAPVLLCNPLGLEVHQRLRSIVPLFAGLDAASRLLVAINRWSLVDSLCAPDAERDEVVAVTDRDGTRAEVRRDDVRAACRDAEDGPDDDVMVTHLRYEAGTRASVRPADGGLAYRWEDGPGAFTGAARRVFLGWLAALAYHGPRVAAPVPEAQVIARRDSLPASSAAEGRRGSIEWRRANEG